MKKLIKINAIQRKNTLYKGNIVNVYDNFLFLDDDKDAKTYTTKARYNSFCNYQYVQLIVTHQGTIKCGDYWLTGFDNTIMKSERSDYISNDKIIGVYPEFSGIPTLNVDFVKEWIKEHNPFIYVDFEINQCDGCYVNVPNIYGVHEMPYPSGSMVCCKEKYNFPIVKDNTLICSLVEKTNMIKEATIKRIDPPNPVMIYWYSKFIKDIDNLFID